VVAPRVYDPGYLRTDTEATSKPDGDFVWRGTIDTRDPRLTTSAIDGIVKILVKQFQKDKLI
jgi:hypothetical protein